MAYGLTWYSEFAEMEGVIFRVEILQRDFVGDPIEVKSAGKPAVISWLDGAEEDPFYPMRTQKAEIQWISDVISGFEISDLFVIDQHEYKVKIYEVDPDTDDLTDVWQGYLVPTDCVEPYASKPYPVDMSASCGLALLRDQYFLDADGRFLEGAMSLFDIIRGCLDQTKLELGIDIRLGLVEKTEFYVVMLSQTYIDVDGLRGMKAFDVLEGILNSVGAFITQERGKWVIQGVRELTAHEVRSYRFNHDGTGYEFSDISQIATIGRVPLDEDTPNLRPTADVDESIATPVSFITNNVAPGIAVNRLTNGTFSPLKTAWGEAFMSSMDGWAPDPKSWGVEGDGKPDDPYRYEIYGSVRTTGDIIYRSSSPQYNVGIYNTPVITVRRDGDKNFYPNLRFVISGAFRCRDGARFMISCRLNDGDRDWVSWLDENGNWTDAKKVLDRKHIKTTVDTPHNPDEFKLLKDMPLQTFEVTSNKITNYLDRPGGWIAKLYFTIHPATAGSDNFPEISNDYSPALWVEDICVSVTTGTIYEGNHAYQIDGKKIIRNGEEYEYKTIVADKLNILTAEQKHDDRRVMTGYASVGAFVLADGWKRKVDGVFTGDAEPLQHITLRERLRLLCAKRRIIEGKFYGYGLHPTNSVINQYDDVEDSYFTITGWSWDLKNRTHDLRLHELNFDELPDEIITLSTDRSDPGRGNRLYSGASGSVSNGSSGSGSGVILEEILLDDFDPYEYEILVEDEEYRVLDIGPLIQSGHIPDFLIAQILFKPDWVTEIEIYRGEDLDPGDIPDGGLLQVRWKGKPDKSGSTNILVELVGSNGEDYILVIPITVTPSPDFAETWPPIFSDIPDLLFPVGIETAQGVLLTDYMDADHAAAIGYTYRVLDKPAWVVDQTIIFNDLQVTANPPAAETRFMMIEIKDSIGRTFIFTVRLVAIAEPLITGVLLDTTTGADELGPIPGSYEAPTRFDVEFTIAGKHTGFDILLTGGGLLGDAISYSETRIVTETESGTYRVYGLTGALSEVGQYALRLLVDRSGVYALPQTIDFVLFDDDYLALIVNAFLSDGILVSYILPEGTSVYDNDDVEIWGVNSEVDGPEHDKVTQKLYSEDGTLIKTEVHTLVTNVTFGAYLLDSSPVARDPGKYKLVTELEKDGLPAMVSSVRFEVKGMEEDGCCEGYATNFGNGTDTNYTLTHGLNTKDLHVSFKRNTDGLAIELAWKPIDLNSIEVGCSARSIPTTNKYRALIEKN